MNFHFLGNSLMFNVFKVIQGNLSGNNYAFHRVTPTNAELDLEEV